MKIYYAPTPPGRTEWEAPSLIGALALNECPLRILVIRCAHEKTPQDRQLQLRSDRSGMVLEKGKFDTTLIAIRTSTHREAIRAGIWRGPRFDEPLMTRPENQGITSLPAIKTRGLAGAAI